MTQKHCAGAGHMRMFVNLAMGIALAMAAGLSQAEANVIATYTWMASHYTWTPPPNWTDGPAPFQSSGQIVLSSPGLTPPTGSFTVTTFSPPLIPQDLDGVVSASFQAFDGPTLTTGTSDIINFTATVVDNTLFLDVIPKNPFGGFFVNRDDTEAYFGVTGPGAHELTVGRGSDNPGSPCNGSQVPDSPSSHCVVTGSFLLTRVEAPEPESLAMLVTALSAFGGLRFARRRNKSSRPRSLPASFT